MKTVVSIVRTKTAPHYMAVYLDGVRILGDKPWGGGTVIAEEELDLSHPNVKQAISRMYHRSRRLK